MLQQGFRSIPCCFLFRYLQILILELKVHQLVLAWSVRKNTSPELDASENYLVVECVRLEFSQAQLLMRSLTISLFFTAFMFSPLNYKNHLKTSVSPFSVPQKLAWSVLACIAMRVMLDFALLDFLRCSQHRIDLRRNCRAWRSTTGASFLGWIKSSPAHSDF